MTSKELHRVKIVSGVGLIELLLIIGGWFAVGLLMEIIEKLNIIIELLSQAN